ncbi:MAG: hypothetical protein KAQ68_07000, partial [Clostridiales bacterium]|nr:hypothetical protein [Clostridiales bacterium]
MKMRTSKIIIFLCLFISVLTGCDKQVKPVEATGPQNPSSEIEGFFAQQQTVEGGEDVSSLNLADIKITKSLENETQVILTFTQGNTTADKDIT